MRIGWYVASLAAWAAQPAFASPSAAACQALPGVEKIAEHPAHFIIFGELHGTNQAPATFGDAVCALSSSATPTLVALELGASGNAALQRAWAGPEQGFADRLIATMPEWKTLRGAQTSEAVLALLVRLHALKVAGRKIDVVAFTGPTDVAVLQHIAAPPTPEQFETWQAENIQRADAAKRYRRVLIFVGNAHARKEPWRPGPTGYAPMAMRLAPSANVLSLHLAYASGMAWNCEAKATAVAPFRSSDLDCGAHPAKGIDGVSQAPHITLSNDNSAYGGSYFVGPITASNPVADRK